MGGRLAALVAKVHAPYCGNTSLILLHSLFWGARALSNGVRARATQRKRSVTHLAAIVTVLRSVIDRWPAVSYDCAVDNIFIVIFIRWKSKVVADIMWGFFMFFTGSNSVRRTKALGK